MLMSTLYSCVLIVRYLCKLLSYIGLKSEYKSQDLAWNLHSLLRPQYVCCCCLLVSISPTFFYETWIYFYLKVRDFCILHHFTHSLSYNTHSWIIEYYLGTSTYLLEKKTCKTIVSFLNPASFCSLCPGSPVAVNTADAQLSKYCDGRIQKYSNFRFTKKPS